MTVSTGTYAGIQTLWSGPWLRDVAGFDRGEVASMLFAVATTTVISVPAGGYIATRLNRMGISSMTFVIWCIFGFMAALAMLSLQRQAAAKISWMLFGFWTHVPDRLCRHCPKISQEPDRAGQCVPDYFMDGRSIRSANRSGGPKTWKWVSQAPGGIANDGGQVFGLGGRA
ncbi:MAG: hypothetical protein QGF09_16435 [Rhodospirillales bacterium]|nr:hypothetical protein [Rhodospirillales bacterium]